MACYCLLMLLWPSALRPVFELGHLSRTHFCATALAACGLHLQARAAKCGFSTAMVQRGPLLPSPHPLPRPPALNPQATPTVPSACGRWAAPSKQLATAVGLSCPALQQVLPQWHPAPGCGGGGGGLTHGARRGAPRGRICDRPSAHRTLP